MYLGSFAFRGNRVLCGRDEVISLPHDPGTGSAELMFYVIGQDLRLLPQTSWFQIHHTLLALGSLDYLDTGRVLSLWKALPAPPSMPDVSLLVLSLWFVPFA